MYQGPASRHPIRGKTIPPPEPKMHGTLVDEHILPGVATTSVVNATPYCTKVLPVGGGTVDCIGSAVPSSRLGGGSAMAVPVHATCTRSGAARSRSRPGERRRRAIDAKDSAAY